MANTLTGLIPTIYQSLDVVSREMVGFIPNVFLNADAAQAAVNQDITYPIAPAATAQDITPGVTAPNAGDNVIAPGTMKITKSRAVPIRWNGEEQRSVSNAGFYQKLLQDQFTQAFRAITNELEADLGGLHYKASRAYGTAGNTPFATAADLTDLAQIRKILVDNGAGMSDLKLILNTTAGAQIRGKQSGLFKVNEAGTDQLLRNGVLGRLEGLDIGESAGVKNFTKGTGTAYQLNGAHSLGATTINVDTGSGTLLAGDVVTINGVKYVAATALSAGSFTINAPGLLAAGVDNDAVSIGNNYAANMAFRKGAIHLVARTPALPVGPDGKAMDMADDMIEVTDPFTGLVFQIAVYRQFRQILYYVGLAWGVGAPKPEHIGLLLG